MLCVYDVANCDIINISGHLFFKEFVEIQCPKRNTDGFNAFVILVNKVEHSVIVNV